MFIFRLKFLGVSSVKHWDGSESGEKVSAFARAEDTGFP